MPHALCRALHQELVTYGTDPKNHALGAGWLGQLHPKSVRDIHGASHWRSPIACELFGLKGVPPYAVAWLLRAPCFLVAHFHAASNQLRVKIED